jgi:phospholipid/cholesterol/gamma-HCH transport system substrate-binding protein
MRRLVATFALALAVPIVLVVGLGAGGDGGAGYEVRAIFDNVASAVPGEDVKVAGAKVGKIESMDVVDGRKAAVVLRIDDDRFTPFRSDATCTVRPQSLIGEKFVECEPGTTAGSPLREIDRGAGEGQHLLSLEHTSSPVDLDLVNDTFRLPFPQRLSILLNELGTGLAGRGGDLNAVIHRANPALRETDDVLRILSRQNRVLSDLARNSDTVLGPLAREKRHVSDFIVQANRTGQATAARRVQLRASLNRLPALLRQLRPLMSDLEGFTDQATPVVTDLGAAAPDVNRVVAQLGPFANAARPAIRSLGKATVTGRPALVRARPLVKDLRSFAKNSRPVSTNLAQLTQSLDKTGGLERILDYLFFQMTAINGYDSIGHYLRAGLIVNLCSTYAVAPGAGCNSRFTVPRSGSASAGGELAPALAKLSGGKGGGSVAPRGSLLQGLLGPSEDPALRRQREQNLERLRRRASGPSPALSADEPLLEYLMGSDR